MIKLYGCLNAAVSAPPSHSTRSTLFFSDVDVLLRFLLSQSGTLIDKSQKYVSQSVKQRSSVLLL